MKRHWSGLVIVLALSLLAASEAEATRLSGIASWRNGTGTWFPCVDCKVKLCKSPGGTGSSCVATQTYAGQYGYANQYSVDLPFSASQEIWYIFLWNDQWSIGSEWSPSWGGGGVGVVIPGGWTSPATLNIGTGLRPLKPTAVYPTNGASTVPKSFTLKWSSGINYDRVGWPATYDLYAYGEGGVETKIGSNLQCNADASGNCTLAITNLVPNARYHWRVEAKLNIGVYAPNPYYVHSSNEFTFTTAVDSNAPVTFMTADYSHFLTAQGCGGSWLDASGTSRGTCQRFKVEDVNGGNLNSGDVVHLKFANTYYVAAENAGGGDVSVRYTSAITWEKFTVQKISGAPGSRIVNGDRISFKTYDGTHYLKAVGYGGGSVNATATGVGSSERFVYETDMH